MTDTQSGWVEANHAYLVAEFARVRTRLGIEAGTAHEPPLALPRPAALDVVVEAFGLSTFERSVLLLCAGAEMDAQIAQACSAATGRGCASFALALAALEQPHWSALTLARPLLRWRLVEVEEGHGLTAAALRIDERVLHFLAGINLLDARLQPFLFRRFKPDLMAAEHECLAAELAQAWLQISPPAVHLGGDDPAGAEDVAAALATTVGMQLHVVRAEDLAAGPSELESFARLWEREAALLPALLLVQCGEAAPSATVVALADRMAAPVIVVSREPLRLHRATLSRDVLKPDATEQRRLWEAVLGASGTALNGTLDGISDQFRLSARAIAAASAVASRQIAAGAAPQSAVWAACRVGGRSRLDDLAQRIPPQATWDDLVLPAAQITALRQVAAQVRQRGRVYEQWGFGRRNARGLGVSALFSGGSGTGKTLAAEVLAGELGLDLYRIDLSSVVNKYVGETEKNLRRVFDAAEDSGAILLFDEADALFGKRSDVKDSHDRYANIEVSYLLQRMEAYRGLAILTTNLKSALDPAFQRRLRFIVNFPFPDAAQREAIWRHSIPALAPAGELDYRKLARLNVTGGHVRNIALNAAFLAADAGERLGMHHMLAAAHVESAKFERPLSETETRGWA
jgi:ATPase family associated with various cellular activities (AAA)